MRDAQRIDEFHTGYESGIILSLEERDQEGEGGSEGHVGPRGGGDFARGFRESLGKIEMGVS